MRSLCLAAVLLTVYPPNRLTAQKEPAAASKVELHGYVQPRFQAIGDSGLFFLRRARLGVQGTLTPWATYKVQGELRSGGAAGTPAAVAATDLYVALEHGRWSGVVGQAKTPFSRELIHQSSTLELPERALVVDSLSLSRDIGVTGGWRVEQVALQVGVYNGHGVNRASNANRRLLYVGRMTVAPVHGLEFGGGAADYRDSTRWEVDVELRRGPWSARAEYLRQDRSAPAGHADGWYALGAYRFAHAPLELVGRVEQFDPSAAPANRTSGYTGGAQYFFRGDDFKVLASYTVFDEQGPGPGVSNNRAIVQMQARF